MENNTKKGMKKGIKIGLVVTIVVALVIVVILLLRALLHITVGPDVEGWLNAPISELKIWHLLVILATISVFFRK